jgi:NAD(P)-dependent dehydrogenase (short-subunit alcohol dehydrogenase family)
MTTPKRCLITGANSGIGKAAAIQLARAGCHVIMACRNQARGEAALHDVLASSPRAQAELMLVDLSLQSSIRALAEAFLTRYDRLDVLIHNAAVFDISQKQARFTEEGVELFWATNHIGPVLLTDLLLDALEAGPQGRVITIGTKGLLAKPRMKIDLSDPEFRQREFSATEAYYQSKLAQAVYTRWLAEQLEDTTVTVNCIRVPAVQVNVDKFQNVSDWMKKLYALKSRFALTPGQMAETYVWAALAEELAGVTGKCFDENRREVDFPRFARKPDNIDAVMHLTLGYLPQV